MPLDVPGRTRATMAGIERTCPEKGGKPLKPVMIGIDPLPMWIVNEEFLVGARHQRASIRSLPFADCLRTMVGERRHGDTRQTGTTVNGHDE